MAYASTVAAVRQILNQGLYAVPSTGAAITGGGAIYGYCSSHAATDITGTGFFSACGANILRGGNLAKSANNVGMRPGDLLVNIESSGGVTPGRVTWHAVSASTFNQASTSASTAFVATAGFDITVSAHAST